MDSFLIHLIETLACSQRNFKNILTYILNVFQKGEKIIHDKIHYIRKRHCGGGGMEIKVQGEKEKMKNS